MNNNRFDENYVLLEVKSLKTEFRLKHGPLEKGRIIRAVDGIDLEVRKGEIYGLVGESGCGKTVTALSIMGLINPPGVISQGEVILQKNNGLKDDLLQLSQKAMKKIRGNEIAMIFQNPQLALNPLYPVGHQINKVFQIRDSLSKKEAASKVLELLKRINIPDAEKRIKEYPHQLSGGMCQRIVIAMALACNPKLLICDEPTASLDVTIQAQILKYMQDIKTQFQVTMLFISHDLGVVAGFCDRIAVMYLGRIVETAKTKQLYKNPKHPYTQALIAAAPVPQPKYTPKYALIKGEPPGPFDKISGCRFRTRCEKADEKCKTEEPELKVVDKKNNNTKVACWHLDQPEKKK